MVFIFVHSAMPGEVSGAESRQLAELFASITGLSYEISSFIVRKAAHFTEFTVLGICLAVNMRDLAEYRKSLSAVNADRTDHALTSNRKTSGIEAAIAAWIIGSLYAATDEFHQLFVAGRSCEFRDMCIDAAGVATGVILASLVMKLYKGRN